MTNLKDSISTGIKWSAAAQFIIQIIKIGRWLVLLYFIPPADFGLFALAMTVVGLPHVLIDDGLCSAIIQEKKTFNRDDLSTYFWFLSIISGVICLLFYLSGSLFNVFFEDSQIASLLVLLSFSNFIESTGKTSNALLRKKLRFKCLAQIETVSFLVGTLVTFGMAFCGYKVWALAVGLLASYFCTAVGNLFSAGFWPRFTFVLASLKRVYIFTRNLTLSRFNTFFLRYFDDFIIGYFFGKTALGIYDRAYLIVHLPMRLIANRISMVLFPAYANELGRDEDLKRIHLKIIKYAALLYLPILGGIILFSRLCVRLFLPTEWSDLAFFLPVLATGGIIHAFLNFNESIFLAKGRSDLQLKYSIITRSVIISSYLIGTFFGVEGIAIGYSIGSFIAFFPESIRALALLGLNLKDIFLNIRKTLFFTFFGSTFIYGIMFLVKGDGLQLILGVNLFLAFFGIYLFRTVKMAGIFYKS